MASINFSSSSSTTSSMTTLTTTTTMAMATSNRTLFSPSHSAPSQLLMGLTFGSLIAISLAGNTLVGLAVYTNKKLRKKENLYFVSLAGADLLLSTLVMPFGAVNLIAEHWPFGHYCKYWMCLDILFVTSSILHLAAISFDRYTHINDPMRYEERMTVGKIGAAILAVWATAIAVAFLPLAFDTYFHRALQEQIDPLTNSTIVTRNGKVLYQCEFNLDPVYAILSSLTSFYIPSALMILAYVKLYRYARRHSKAIRKQQEEVRMPLLVKPNENEQQCGGGGGATGNMAVGGAQNGIGTQNQHQKKQKQQQQRQGNMRYLSKLGRMDGDQKARVTLGVITGVFLASWLPFFVANIIRSFCNEVSFLCLPDWLFITLTWMGYANSAQNPIIYSIFNRDFRQAFRKILMCGRRPNPTNVAMKPPDQAALNLPKQHQQQLLQNEQQYSSASSSMVANGGNGSTPLRRSLRKSEPQPPPAVIRKESPCVVFDVRNGPPRSASIVAKLMATNHGGGGDHSISDSNGFQKLDEAKNALDSVMPYTKLSQVSPAPAALNRDRVSTEENSSQGDNDTIVWLPREDAEDDRKRSLIDYMYCWHTSLALMNCMVVVGAFAFVETK